MIVGPFSGEPGFELIYWLPYLRANGLSPDDLAITRGGAGVWYPCHTQDAYELVGVDTYRSLFEQRYIVTRVQKSFGPSDVLDAAILDALGAERFTEELRHPADMYQRLQDAANWPFEPLPAIDRHPLVGDEPYIAAAFYTSDQLPANRAREAANIVRWLADRGNKVAALRAKQAVDDHSSVRIPEHPNVQTVEFDPEDSLKVQSQVIAHADALIGTYGGLSYLGPLYGVPTRAFHCFQPNPVHVAREDQMVSELGASYERVRL